MKPLRTTVAAAVTLALAALGAAAPAQADVPSAQGLLQAGAAQGVADGYPAVVGLVRRGDTGQYASAGLSALGTRTPADPKAQFRIGSNTKAFVSTVILQLEAEGRLSIDDTVAKWLPGAVNAGGFDGSKITIRELLNHTSGLPDYAKDAAFAVNYGANFQPYQTWAPQALVDLALRQHAPTSAPGQQWSYANTNYVLAGMVITAVTGNSPAAEIQQRIITPLGLTNTSFPTSDPTLHGNYLHGYEYPLGLPGAIFDVTTSDVQTFGAAGAMVSTLDDLATFSRALVTGRLLAPAQEAELKTTVPISATVGYGLGVFHEQLPCGQWAWGHNGAVLGYFSDWLSSEDGTKEVVRANTEFHLLPDTQGQKDTEKATYDAFCAL